MYRALFIIEILAVMLLAASCDKKEGYEKGTIIDKGALSEMKVAPFMMNSRAIRKHIAEMASADKGSLASDRFMRSYYGGHGAFVWIDKCGVVADADSLLNYLSTVEESGLSPQVFRLSELRNDLQRARMLDFEEQGVQGINQVLARLEYNLTRAYLRYTAGQYFGYVNPDQVLNHLDVKDSDSVHVEYNRVFDVPVGRPGHTFFKSSMRKVGKDSMGMFLHEVQPQGSMYKAFCQHLKSTGLSKEQRMTTLCNIEKCRWRQPSSPDEQRKYVMVNIPSFSLRAVDGDSTLIMRVGCGTLDKKTPMLSSHIYRMDVNPQWIVPKSIAQGIVYREGYLRKERMFIVDKKLGKLDVSQASYDKVMSGEQYIVQEGGAGNSLGRIIFRFKNNFAVYLHDTSSPWLFERSQRAVSHGCVRVQKPYELAVFLLEDKDEKLKEKIRYSMNADLENADEDLMVHTLNVDPGIPLYITYFTMLPQKSGVMEVFKDVYGYDQAIIKELIPYINEQ